MYRNKKREIYSEKDTNKCSLQYAQYIINADGIVIWPRLNYISVKC